MVATRVLTGTAGEIEVTNAGGVSPETVALIPTAVTPGTYGDDTHVSQITVDENGRVTNAQAVTISAALTPTGVTPGTYGDTNNVGQFTVDQYGRITAAQQVAISGGGGGGGLVAEYTWLVNSGNQPNSAAYAAPGLYAVNDEIRVNFYSTDNTPESGGLLRVSDVYLTPQTGIGNYVDGGSKGALIQGQYYRFQVVTTAGQVMDLRRLGLIWNGSNNSQHSRFNSIAASFGTSLRIMATGGGGKQTEAFVASETLNAAIMVCNFPVSFFKFGTTGAASRYAPVCTFTAATPTVVTTSIPHGLTNNQMVWFRSTRLLPAGLLEVSPQISNDYFVTNVTTNTFELTRYVGGPSIPSADAGTGTIWLHKYGNFFTAAQTNLPISSISIASPGVVTCVGHGRSANDPIVIGCSIGGTLPSPIVSIVSSTNVVQVYYVKTVLSADTFTISTTPGGTAINTTSSLTTSGTWWMWSGTTQANVTTHDLIEWSGRIRRVAVGMRVAGDTTLRENYEQHARAWGDGNFDFTILPTVIPFVLEQDDGPQSNYWFQTAYGYAAGGIYGPLEKNKARLDAAYCDYACYVMPNVRADTIPIEVHAATCRHWYWEFPSADATPNVTLYCESRQPNNDGSPSIYSGTAKQTVLGGQVRADGGTGPGILVDRQNQFGADTFILKNFSRRQFYGSDVFKRLRYLAGQVETADTDRGSFIIYQPFKVTLGSNVVEVFLRSHGLNTGAKVRFTSFTPGSSNTINGTSVPTTELTVTVLDANRFTIVGSGNASADGTSLPDDWTNCCYNDCASVTMGRVMEAGSFTYTALSARIPVANIGGSFVSPYYSYRSDLGTYIGDTSQGQPNSGVVPFDDNNVKKTPTSSAFPTTRPGWAVNQMDGGTVRFSVKGTWSIGASVVDWPAIIATQDCLNYTGTVDPAADANLTFGGVPYPQIVTAATKTLTKNANGMVFSNEGAAGQVAFTLPSAELGLNISFAVVTAQNVRVIPATLDKVWLGSSASAGTGSAAHIDSATPGSTVTMETVNVTDWFTKSKEAGTWTVT